MLNTFDLFNQPAYALAEHGANLAATKAENDSNGWKEEAWRLLNVYVDECGSQPFQAEDFRQWAYEKSLPKPVNERAFGWLFIKARKDHLLSKYGIGPVKNAKAHAANSTIWIKKFVD